MQYKGIGEAAFKKFAQRIKEEYAYLKRENLSLWIYLQSDDFSIQKLENILDILREQLYIRLYLPLCQKILEERGYGKSSEEPSE